MEALGFIISGSTVYDFLALTLFKIKPFLNLDNQSEKILEKIAVYLAKVIIYFLTLKDVPLRL